ncbi:hypothetical protein TNCV_2112581 [Trichonephila clavipes]|nr:hypothetical protein TNCV_2112581 [Trichonephila clavipes]
MSNLLRTPGSHESIMPYSHCARIWLEYHDMGHGLLSWKWCPGVSLGDRCVMDDNTTIYHARNVQNWLAIHHSDFQHLPWLPHISDLNLIENVFKYGRKTHPRQHYSLRSNLQDLKHYIANACI